LKEQIQQILEDKSILLTEAYFKLQRLFESKYGENTIVLMEIGTFFEVYEVNNEIEQVGKAKEIAELLNIQLTRKNKNILETLFSGIKTVECINKTPKLVA
jgi:DNA mismatch repair protein MutS